MEKIAELMHSHTLSSQKLAISMAALAGFTDALGFLIVGRFFVSFMSGNSTLFSVGLINHRSWSYALMPLGIIILFVTGVMAGRVIRHFNQNHPSGSVLAFMALCLFLASCGAEFGLAIVAAPMMAVAMGAANNVFVRQGEVSIGVTYMTGTLVKFGQHLAGHFLGEKNGHWRPYLMLWLGLLSGAICGAAIFEWQGLHGIWLASGFCCVLTATMLWQEHRQPQMPHDQHRI